MKAITDILQYIWKKQGFRRHTTTLTHEIGGLNVPDHTLCRARLLLQYNGQFHMAPNIAHQIFIVKYFEAELNIEEAKQ